MGGSNPPPSTHHASLHVSGLGRDAQQWACERPGKAGLQHRALPSLRAAAQSSLGRRMET